MASALRLHALIILSLFLFAFTTTSVAQFVVDQDGEPLYSGGSYYILPVIRGQGGGLELSKTAAESCPTAVVQARSETSRGLPARLASPYYIRFIGSNLPLAIEFQPERPSPCHGESKLQWKVEEESQMVKIASLEEERFFGPFKIEPYRNHYKLVYCESDESRDNHHECRDLGISIDEHHNRRLVVKDGEPLMVQFAKAGDRGGDDSSRMSIV